jgi:Gpi18-like mannosyltransferase
MKKIGIHTFLKIFSLFVLSRLLILFAFYIALHYYDALAVNGSNFQYCKSKLLNCLGNWDSGWYLSVVKNGYVTDTINGGQSNYGFFPFYPMAIKMLGLVIHNDFAAGIIISNILLLVSSIFLFLLSLNIYQNRSIALLTVGVLFFFPGSYLLSGVYSESAFICFSIMSIYFFEKGDYALSGISGFFLTLTRPFGVLILLPLFLRYISKYGIDFKPRVLYLILIPSGMFSFFVYCYLTTGDFLFYIHAKESGWGTKYAIPWQVLIQGLKTSDHYLYFNSFYTVSILALSVFLIRFSPLYLLVWILLLIAAPLSNGVVNLVCMPRYILVCFPLFMMIGAFATKHKWGWLLIFLLVAVNFVLSGYFQLGYEFAA